MLQVIKALGKVICKRYLVSSLFKRELAVVLPFACHVINSLNYFNFFISFMFYFRLFGTHTHTPTPWLHGGMVSVSRWISGDTCTRGTFCWRGGAGLVKGDFFLKREVTKCKTWTFLLQSG